MCPDLAEKPNVHADTTNNMVQRHTKDHPALSLHIANEVTEASRG